METPRGLIIILGLLALGFCWDVAIVAQGGPGVVIMVLVLVGRIAAIVGILLRTTFGWWLAFGFFGLIVVLNIAAAPLTANPAGALVRIAIPLGCLVYLGTLRSEFD